jgi:hypothetical protein
MKNITQKQYKSIILIDFGILISTLGYLDLTKVIIFICSFIFIHVIIYHFMIK